MIPFPFKNTGYRPPAQSDPRNFILEKAQPVIPFPVAYKTDLTAVGIYDQEQIPDCVENAITKAKQYHIYKVSQVVTNLSRRFLAYYTVLDDGFPISEGTSILNALKRAQKTGISEAQYFPDDHSLDETTFSTVLPSLEAVNNAATHTISSYAFLSDLSAQGLKNAIYQNGFVIVGLKLDKNWWTDTAGNVTWDASKILPLRVPTDLAGVSGHCVIMYAYDNESFYVWNSFGTDWGYQGHGWFGPEYLPYIYEAATILDLTPDQIQKAQQGNQIVNTIQQLQNLETPKNEGRIQAIITQLWTLLAGLFR